MRRNTTPALPQLLDRKIYKSGQTRGADDDVIFQNRVGRNSTVLIPYQLWTDEVRHEAESGAFENGFIVLIKPEEYFSLENPNQKLHHKGLEIGKNCLVFYETRHQWHTYNPDILHWEAATSRVSPLGGQYAARVPATTATMDGGKINRGYTQNKMKGAGIRQYEYASSDVIAKCRVQLEAEYWLCVDAIDAAISFGMSEIDAHERKRIALEKADEQGLLDYDKLISSRIIDEQHNTVCPLCLQKLSGFGFYTRLSQAEGREVPDITVTEINLFHIDELKYGCYNHKPYNLGWGHHHCNVVVKDSGILPTLRWMKNVILRNESHGTEIDV